MGHAGLAVRCAGARHGGRSTSLQPSPRAAACRRQTNNQNKRHNAGDEMKEQRAHCNENEKKDPREEEVQRKHYEQE